MENRKTFMEGVFSGRTTKFTIETSDTLSKLEQVRMLNAGRM